MMSRSTVMRDTAVIAVNNARDPEIAIMAESTFQEKWRGIKLTWNRMKDINRMTVLTIQQAIVLIISILLVIVHDIADTNYFIL